MAQGCDEEVGGADLSLVRLDLAEGDARGVVDNDVDELPAGAAAVALAGPVAGDAVAGFLEAAEFLDVDVDHVAGIGVFIAAGRRGWIEIAGAGEPGGAGR